MTSVDGGSEPGSDEQAGTQPSRETVGGVPRLLVLGKARDILEAFSVRDPQLTLAELAARTGQPMSTCLRLVRNLTHEGMLERSGDQYRIGLTIVRWASSALEGRTIVVVAAPTLDWLRDETGESALLSVRDGVHRVVAAVAKSRHAVVREVHVGEVAPLHVGSTGKTFLAFDADTDGILRGQKLAALTPGTTTSHAKLEAAVARVRSAGYATSVEEAHIGVVGISAPVFNRASTMVATVGISGPLQRMDAQRVEAHIPRVLEAAWRISENMGMAWDRMPGQAQPAYSVQIPRHHS